MSSEVLHDSFISVCPLMQASVSHWPEIFSKPEIASRQAEIMHKLKVVRPVVETG